MNKSIRTPKKILLGLQEGTCNLKCAKCYTHGENLVSTNVRHSGIMSADSLKKILDEVEIFQPRIAPQTWDEPLINPHILNYLKEIKTRNLAITMDTNGLLLNESKMNSMVEIKVDSIFISLDALTPEAYKKVRGVDKLNFLIEKVHQFIKIRGTEKFPRIGVSFVIEPDNYHEKDLFIDYWKNTVDVVRINQQFLSDRKLAISPQKKRTACWSLDDSLMIHFNGEAALCCVDTHYENLIGNVITDGVLNVWNGTFFSNTRDLHAQGNFENIKICNSCELWSNDQPINQITEDILISKTNSHTYYNRVNKLDNILNNRFVDWKN